MAIIDRLVQRGERVRRITRPHVMGLVGQLLRRGGHLLIAVVVARLASAELVHNLIGIEFLVELGADVWLRPIPGWITTGCMAVGGFILVLAAVDAVRWARTRYVLTDQRVLHVSGAWIQLVVDVPLDRIADVALRQSPLGSRLDYGDLLVRTAAAQTGQPMRALCGPLAFRQAMEARRQSRLAETTPRPRPVRAAAGASEPVRTGVGASEPVLEDVAAAK